MRFKPVLGAVVGAISVTLLSPGTHATELASTGSGPLWWSGMFDTSTTTGPASANLERLLEPRSPTWGLKGPMYAVTQVAADSPNFDLKRRVVSFAERSFLTIGLGWNEFELDDGDDSAGPHLSVEGRWGIGGAWTLYGQSVWVPELESTGHRGDMTGNGFEAGIAFQPLPNMSFHAGYRTFRIDFTDGRTGIDDSTISSGVLLGAGIRF